MERRAPKSNEIDSSLHYNDLKPRVLIYIFLLGMILAFSQHHYAYPSRTLASNVVCGVVLSRLEHSVFGAHYDKTPIDGAWRSTNQNHHIGCLDRPAEEAWVYVSRCMGRKHQDSKIMFTLGAVVAQRQQISISKNQKAGRAVGWPLQWHWVVRLILICVHDVVIASGWINSIPTLRHLRIFVANDQVSESPEAQKECL
jgi:hypothetical protein